MYTEFCIVASFASVRRIKQRQKDEQVRSKAHMKQRMETIITLKKDIAANRVGPACQFSSRLRACSNMTFMCMLRFK